MRLPIVGVLGSGSEPHESLAEPLGRWLARQPVHLLTGGGQGVMASVSRAFFESDPRQGLVIGILPHNPDTERPRTGYPNPWVELPIVTHLPLSGADGSSPMSRNHINVLSCACLIALPGSAGTWSEIALAVRYGKPIVVYGIDRHELKVQTGEIPVTTDFELVKSFVLQNSRL